MSLTVYCSKLFTVHKYKGGGGGDEGQINGNDNPPCTLLP